MPRYRVVLCGIGIPSAAGKGGADCLTAGFRNRPWHSNAVCTWDGSVLTLVVENDVDRDGRASLDEFSDAISACMADPGNGDLRVVSAEVIPP